jgi:hypothetical protein
MKMKNEVAKFMMKEIDARIARRKRPLDPVLAHKLGHVREAVNAGAVLTGEQEAFLKRSYEWNTDPARIKWK